LLATSAATVPPLLMAIGDIADVIASACVNRSVPLSAAQEPL
jgi:hypothetical protein